MAAGEPGPGRADPGRGRRAEAGAGRAGQPRGRQARGQPGDGRRRGHRAAAGEVQRAGVPAGALADKQAAAAHADTAPGRVPRSRRRRPSPQGKAEAARRRPRPASPACRVPRARRWPSWSPTRARPSRRTRRSAPRSPRRSRSIFAATEADVKKILDGIDPKVEAEFEKGEAAARAAFETYVAAKMSAYKKDRYGGWLGGLRWAKDKLFGMPDKVNEFYEAGRELYLKQMDGVISRVADIVGSDLTAAKQRIAKGRAEIATYVKSLPAGPAEGRDRRRRRRSATSSSSSRATSTTSRTRSSTTLAIEVRRGAQGARRADRGAAGGEQGPGRQGDRRHQGGHQHDPRARRDAHERPGPRRARRSATSSATRSASSATSSPASRAASTSSSATSRPTSRRA